MSAGLEKNAKWYDHSTNKNTSGSSGDGWKSYPYPYPYSWHKGEAAAAAKTTPEPQKSWWDVKSADIMELADDRFVGQRSEPWPTWKEAAVQEAEPPRTWKTAKRRIRSRTTG